MSPQTNKKLHSPPKNNAERKKETHLKPFFPLDTQKTYLFININNY